MFTESAKISKFAGIKGPTGRDFGVISSPIVVPHKEEYNKALRMMSASFVGGSLGSAYEQSWVGGVIVFVIASLLLSSYFTYLRSNEEGEEGREEIERSRPRGRFNVRGRTQSQSQSQRRDPGP